MMRFWESRNWPEAKTPEARRALLLAFSIVARMPGSAFFGLGPANNDGE